MKLKSYTESKTQNLHFQICLSMHLLCMIYKMFIKTEMETLV